MKINPGNCVKLKNGIIALVDENDKLIDIKTGRIVSDLKKFDKNFANIPLNKVGESRFDIEIVYENIKLDNIIYTVNHSYNKGLIEAAYEFGARYLVNDNNNLFFTNIQPYKTQNICDETDRFIHWNTEEILENSKTFLFEVNWCKSFLPFVKENDFIVLEELLEK